jgi:hypothetical protein
MGRKSDDVAATSSSFIYSVGHEYPQEFAVIIWMIIMNCGSIAIRAFAASPTLLRTCRFLHPQNSIAAIRLRVSFLEMWTHWQSWCSCPHFCVSSTYARTSIPIRLQIEDNLCKSLPGPPRHHITASFVPHIRNSHVWDSERNRNAGRKW